MPRSVSNLNCNTPIGGEQSASILTRVCGHVTNSDYGILGNCSTATYMWNIPDGFEDMGYSSEGNWGKFDNKFFETIDELRHFRPVLFNGTLNFVNLSSYHTWVGDGLQTWTYNYLSYHLNPEIPDCLSYTNYYFGMNWGWGGRGNAYYLATGSFTNISTNDTYDTYIKILTNIRP